MSTVNSFGTRTALAVGGRTYQMFSLPELERAGFPEIARLPFSLKILLENMLRQYKAANPNLPVIIKADASIPYQRVVDVLDLLGRLEITELGLVTQKIVK